MRKDLTTAILAVVIFTVGLGLLYPLAMTGAGQAVFPNRSDGSFVEVDGERVGSRLIGQDFRKPVLDASGEPRLDADGAPILEADTRYFQTRPSATGDNGAATAFSNLGPNSQDLKDAIDANAEAYLALEGRDNPGLELAGIPPDAVQTSASNVDPHISKGNARIQAGRVARVRGIERDRVLDLIDDYTDGRFLSLIGEPGVNVLELNLALDREAPR